MKKIVSTILVSTLVLSLCACSSSRLDDLERRVSALEEKTGITQQTTEDNTQPTTQNNSENASEETTTAVEGNIYDLSNMSAEEVANEMIFYIDNRPQQGDTYEEIQARFKTAPTTVNVYDLGIYNIFGAYSSSDIETISLGGNNISINQDEFIFVNYTNALKAMDGSTVDVQSNEIGVGICVAITDYTKAEAVFNAIETYFNSNSRFTNVTSNREGNEWKIYFDIVNEDGNGSYGGSNVVMRQVNNGYIFSIKV